jgi:hypothetical protein
MEHKVCSFAASYGVEKLGDLEALQVSTNGLSNISHLIVTFCLLNGTDVVKTLAYVCIWMASNILKNVFVTNEKMGLPNGPSYFLLALIAVYLYAALL